jgi:hypothetical protein
MTRHAHMLFVRGATFYASAEVEAVRPGHGDGAFVVVRAVRA